MDGNVSYVILGNKYPVTNQVWLLCKGGQEASKCEENVYLTLFSIPKLYLLQRFAESVFAFYLESLEVVDKHIWHPKVIDEVQIYGLQHLLLGWPTKTDKKLIFEDLEYLYNMSSATYFFRTTHVIYSNFTCFGRSLNLFGASVLSTVRWNTVKKWYWSRDHWFLARRKCGFQCLVEKEAKVYSCLLYMVGQ